MWCCGGRREAAGRCEAPSVRREPCTRIASIHRRDKRSRNVTEGIKLRKLSRGGRLDERLSGRVAKYEDGSAFVFSWLTPCYVERSSGMVTNEAGILLNGKDLLEYLGNGKLQPPLPGRFRSLGSEFSVSQWLRQCYTVQRGPENAEARSGRRYLRRTKPGCC